MKKILIIMIIMIIATTTVIAVQPTQQYYKSYINPFYRESMVLNTNYTYNLTVNPPDGISSVTSAIINFNGQINGQTQTFTLWVNGQSCNNPTYSVATAFSTTGNVQFAFDCTNRITKAGTYNITLRSAVNTGALQGWLDLTYMNRPKGDQGLTVHGTEYVEGDDGTVFLQLRDADGVPIQNGTCYLDIYWPVAYNITHPKYLDDAYMLYLENGIFYYDFVVPAFPGLYMTEARCKYTINKKQYYTLASGKSPVRNVSAGTFTGDTFVLNDFSEWLYTQCDSSTAAGTKSCDSSLTWQLDQNSSSLTSMSVVYLGESNGASLMTMYYWNWISSTWVVLPNTLTFKATAAGGVPSGVDEYVTNNIPVSNSTINAALNNSVRVRFQITQGSTFKIFNNWINIITSEETSTVQDLRGSGEVHVGAASSEQVAQRFYKIDTCDGFIDGRCATFTNDGEFDLAEGELEEYINISAVSNQPHIDIPYYSPFTVDCTALYWIKRYNGTAWVDYQNYTLYSQPAAENCVITLEEAPFVAGDTYQYWIKFDNYMKWEVDWTKAMMDVIYPKTQEYCSIYNWTYDMPVTESTIISNDSIINFCQELYDDIYWASLYYNDSLLIDLAGEYASYVQELRYYRGVLYDRFYYLTLGNNTPNMAEYYARKTWEYPVKNLTYYPPQVDMTNYTRIDQTIYAVNQSIWSGMQIYYNGIINAINAAVNILPGLTWNYTTRNLTYYEHIDMTNYTWINSTMFNYYTSLFNEITQIPLNVWTYTTRNLTYYPAANIDYTQVAENVWNYTTRNLTYYPTQVDLTNYTLINEGVWMYNNRTLTYYEHIDMTNYTLINEGVWTYTTRNLTYYPTQQDLTNYTEVAINVWTYVTRNLTYYPPVSNLTAQDVWEYVNRNLTYYPAQVDLTNYSLINEGVWTYSVRNLTYYTDMTNYTQITDTVPSAVWTYTTRNLTYYPPMNVTTQEVVVQNVTVNVTTQEVVVQNVTVNVTTQEVVVQNVTVITQNVTVQNVSIIVQNVSVDNNAIAVAVWNATTRDLTYYPPQIDLTNYSQINEGVWTYNNRNLTYYPAQQDLTNYTLIESGVWAYTNRTLTYYPTQQDLTNYTLINEGVWTYNNRNLTYYPTQQDLTNYTLIGETVWTYATRDLTYYQVNNITASDVWNYINRTLTYYEINNITATDVWTYNNRTLTYYPSQQDLTNYTAIWEYPNRNLTYYEPAYINTTAIAENTWNYTARYTHGIVLN